MRRLHWLTLASFGVLAACRQPDSALRVDITIKSTGTARVKAECVKLAVLVNGEQTKSLIVPRPMDDTLVFGIIKTPDLPQTVSLQVSGLVGSPCTDETALQLNARGPVLEATFPTSGVQPFAMDLEPPGRNLDGDADGYVGSSFGGPDCRDNDAQVFPGAVQICNSQNDTDCDGVVGCDDPGCTSAPFCADQATKLVVRSIPSDTMQRGDCLGPIDLQLQNAFGARKAVRDTPVSFTHSIQGVTVHATATCTDAPVSTLSVLYDTTDLPPIYLKADETAFGTDTFRATADRVAMPATATVEVHPRPFTSLKFTSMAQTLAAGTCGATPVILELFDAQMRRTDVDALTTISLNSTPDDLNSTPIFFSDASCATTVTQATLMPGQGRVTLYLLARRAGTFSLSASPPMGMGTGDTQMLTVTPSTATRLAYTNMPLALQTTVSCSAATLDVEVQDQFGNPVPVTQALGLSFAVTNNYPLAFYAASDTACGVALTTFTIPAGMSRVSLRLVASLATPQLMVTVSAVTPPSPLTSATQALNVGTGPASKFTWVGMPQTPLAGVCSAMPLTLQLLDNSNNASSQTTALTFALSATLGMPPQSPVDTTFRFYSGAGCQTDLNGSLVIPPNTSQAQVYFRANKVRTNFEVRATGTLTGPDAPSTGHSVLANLPANLTFSTTNLAQTAAAGACSPNPYTVNVSDQYGNPTSFPTQQTVTVTSNPSGVLVGTAPTCNAGNTVTLNAGSMSTTFNATATRVPAGNTYQLSASVSTFSTPSAMPASLTVTPATPQLVSTPSGSITLMANPGNCQNISLVRQDTYLNPAPTSGTFNLGVTAPAGAFDIFPQQDCNGTAGTAIPMNNASTVAFSVRAKQAGTHMLQFAAQGATTSINVTITPGASVFQFTTPSTGTNMASTSIQAGGCATVTLARRDTFGNDVPLTGASALTFTPSDASVTVHSAAGCTSPTTSISMAAGESSKTFYVKGTSTTQVWTVGATLAAQSATLTLTVTPGTSTLSFVAPVNGTASVVANDCVVVTLKREDSQGNPVPIPMGVTTATLGVTGAISVFDNGTCTMPTVTGSIPVMPGTSTKTFSVRATLVGTPSILITLNGQAVTLNVSVAPNAFTTLVLENVPASLTAGGCSAGIVVRRKDSYTNDITTDATLTVNLTSTGFGFSSTQTSCASPQPTASVTIVTGSAVSTEPVYLTGTAAAALVTVTAASTSPAASITANSAIVPGPATQLVFTTTAGAVTVPGCGTPLSVELRDVHNNRITPSSNYNVALSSNLTAAFFPRAGCMAPAATTLALTSAVPTGTFSFQPNASGTHTISVSGAGPLSNSQMWTVNPGPAAQLRWRTVPTAAPARFACVAAGVVESRDNNGNLTTVTADTTVTLTPSVTSLQFFSDAACTTPANTTVIPNGSDAAPGLFMFATGGPANVTLSSAPSLTAPALVTVTPGAPSGSLVVTTGSPNLEAGGCTAITVTRKDGGGTDLATGTTLATLATGAASVELHTNATCTQVATSPVPIVFGHGTSSLSTLWAKGKSAAPATATTAATVTLTAASVGSTNGTTNLTVYPLVRRGSCNLADTESSKRCVVSATNPPFPAVDISRSFLVFSSTGRPATNGGNQVDPANQNVECHLDTNAGTSVDVVCTRAGTAQAMSVNYQIVSFGRDAASGQGISVQHFPAVATSTSAATTSVTLTPAVDTAKSFLLVSSTLGTVTVNNSEGFPLVRFPMTGTMQGTVDIESPTAAPTSRTVSVQVVTMGWSGASANHTFSANPAITAGNYDVTTSSIAGSFPLVMAQAADGSAGDVMCKRRLNARSQSNTVIRLHRGTTTTPPAGCTTDAVTAVAVQRVTFPGQTVNQADVNIANMAVSANTSSFGAVAKDRAITFLAMQGPGGQSGGESNYLPMSPTEADDLGAFSASVDFNGAGTQVAVTRASNTGVNVASTFTPIVVVFDP